MDTARDKCPPNYRNLPQAGDEIACYVGRRMNNPLHPLFRPEVLSFESACSTPRPARARAQRGGFCGARIHPQCLRIDPQGTVCVCLAAPTESWFDLLSQLGEVLHLTRNPIGVLGRLGKAPKLWLGQKSPLPSGPAGDYLPNLAEYGSLWAFREDSPGGPLYGLEVRDTFGIAFERVVLPAEADRPAFSHFVVNHQSAPEQAGSWFSLNHASSARRRSQIASRIPRLRSMWATGDHAIRRLPVRLVPRLLAAAARSQMELRTKFFHTALIRSVTWTPRTTAETRRRDGVLEFFHGDTVGLHLDRLGSASVWLWTRQCSCCSEQRWQIEIGDARETVGLSLAAGGNTSEDPWRELIKACL
jgi:hypothetical protein